MASWFSKISAVDPNQNVNWGGDVRQVNRNPFTPQEGGNIGGGSQPNYQEYELSPPYLAKATSGQVFTNGRGFSDFTLNLMI